MPLQFFLPKKKKNNKIKEEEDIAIRTENQERGGFGGQPLRSWKCRH
jgi:hypothetical protein